MLSGLAGTRCQAAGPHDGFGTDDLFLGFQIDFKPISNPGNLSGKIVVWMADGHTSYARLTMESVTTREKTWWIGIAKTGGAGRYNSIVREAPRFSRIISSEVASFHPRSCACAAMRRSNGSRVHERAAAVRIQSMLGGSSTIHRSSVVSEFSVAGPSLYLPDSINIAISKILAGETLRLP